VATVCGVDADTIRSLAHDLAAAPTAAVYGRIGTCTQEFGTLASWLVDVVNLLSGNLDRRGGAMFAKGAVGQPSTKGTPGQGRGTRFGRVVSRVGKRPESFGEFPVSALTEEIETPGEGQVRALITVAGNPVSSNPNANRLDAALASLECMVCVDPYINETTRHADVILPPPSALQKSHYDLALLNFAVHNVANYSPAVLPLDTDDHGVAMNEWEILLRLTAIVSGMGAQADIDPLDDMVAASVAGAAGDELLAEVADRRGPERVLDLMLRTGPYGL
jgi:anaerobic selenocysteine-containing dehydrogenase